MLAFGHGGTLGFRAEEYDEVASVTTVAFAQSAP